MELAQIFVPQRQAVNLDRQLTCCGVCMTISLLTPLDSVSFIQGMHGCLPPWSRLIVFPRIPPHLSPFRYHFQQNIVCVSVEGTKPSNILLCLLMMDIRVTAKRSAYSFFIIKMNSLKEMGSELQIKTAMILAVT